MNYIEMTHICEGCDKDCESACADGSCALADHKEPHSDANDEGAES